MTRGALRIVADWILFGYVLAGAFYLGAVAVEFAPSYVVAGLKVASIISGVLAFTTSFRMLVTIARDETS